MLFRTVKLFLYSNHYAMESKKIESIFIDYLNKENTNYALLISGKWGSGKTYLWKNILEKKANEKEFKSIYISLNGISDTREIEGILLSKVLPFSDKLENEFIKNSLKFLRNGVNTIGNIFGGGTQLADLTRGIDLNLDLSSIVLCFDDLERCQMPLKEVLGLINDYTEHKNLKVIICADEAEIKKKEYNKIKEKVIGRVLKYTANYNELFESYISNSSDKEFSEFLNKKKNIIISFFEKHDIQNLRTFGFYLENLSLLYKYYIEENETEVNRMLFFTAIISNELKRGKLNVSNLNDKKGIDDFMRFISLSDLNTNVNGFLGIHSAQTKAKEKKKKSYNEKFTDKYLSNQNDKDKYLFSEAIYEFVLSGYLDTDKLKNEIDSRNGKAKDSEEIEAYNNFTGYNFRILENNELDAYISKVLMFSEQGKYNMYSYQTIFNNLSYQIKIGSLEIEEKELITRLKKGLDIAKNTSDIDVRQISHIRHFKNSEDYNEIEKRILELHNEKSENEKKSKANQIFEVISKDLVEVDDFFNEVLNSENTLFEFVDSNNFFNELIQLRNKNLLVFSNALFDTYKKQFFEFPEKALPFFKRLHELITIHLRNNVIRNPKKVILEELLIRIDEIIKRFDEAIARKR